MAKSTAVYAQLHGSTQAEQSQVSCHTWSHKLASEWRIAVYDSSKYLITSLESGLNWLSNYIIPNFEHLPIWQICKIELARPQLLSSTFVYYMKGITGA
jgi:hypothetical protein